MTVHRSAPKGMRAPRRGGGSRLMTALIIAVVALFSFFSSRVYNPVTGEDQYISLTPKQEIALGLQAMPKMIEQHGGLYPEESLQEYVDQVGEKLIEASNLDDETDWEFEFHLLRDPQTINAFALPGGQMFITAALYSRLETEGQLAGVLGHEIGHVVARHGAQRIAKAKLTEGLTEAVVVATDPGAAQAAAIIGNLVNMKYGREDELESDMLGIRFMVDAGYDPRAMIAVMEILAEAGGGSSQPEFFSTHPNPDNRIGRIEEAIQQVFPNGVPEGLIP